MAQTVRRPGSALRPGESPLPHPLPLAYTLVVSAALVGVTFFGLLVDGAYRVSPGVQERLPAVLRGQDLLTLLTVPVLITAAHRAHLGSLRWHLVWLGLMLYYAYSYFMYALSPFNDVFLVYTSVIAMSGYGFLNGLLRLDMAVVARSVARVPRRGLGTFLLVVAGAFLGLWLSMIVPAVPGGLPGGRMTYDIASTVHVLDLSVMLPLVVGTGWLLLRAHPAGAVLGIVLLCKLITLGLSLVFMNLVFWDSPNSLELGLWGLVIPVATAWLTACLRRMSPPRGPWIRHNLWC